MRDFLKDLKTRYKAKLLFGFLFGMAILLSIAFTAYDRELVLWPFAWAAAPALIFLLIAWAKWEKFKEEYKASWNEDPTAKITYYVDGSNGRDTNDGLTPDTAFASIDRAIEAVEHGDSIKVLNTKKKT